MTHGRKVCNILKEIRREIADKNEIEYTTADCHFEGECQGTCPKCESEVKYLETELNKRKLLGKAVAVAGISLGVAGTFSACNTPQQTDWDGREGEIIEDTVYLDTTSIDTIPTIKPLTARIYDIASVGGFTSEIYYMVDPLWEYDNTDLLEIQKQIDEEAKKVYTLADVDVMPEFMGGNEELRKFLSDNLTYPPTARHPISGIVHARFIVGRNGAISEITIDKSPAKYLSDEVVRVIKLMPQWKPAQKDGKPVRVYFILPIEFKVD